MASRPVTPSITRPSSPRRRDIVDASRTRPPSRVDVTDTLDLSTAAPDVTFDHRSRTMLRTLTSPAHRGRSLARPGIQDDLSDWQAFPERTAGTLGDSWWPSSGSLSPRAWDDPKHKTVTAEQREAYKRTRERVSRAAVNVLGVAGDITHELLKVSANLMCFAPIPGLEEVAKTLLKIWDALQGVDINRSACLHLTDRCATLLMSIREEVHEAGDKVSMELVGPLHQLLEYFKDTHKFLCKLSRWPFFRRYLQRDDIERSLNTCHRNLTDALNMFSTAVQVRTLKQVIVTDKQRQVDTAAIIHAIQDILPASDLGTVDPTAHSTIQSSGTVRPVDGTEIDGHVIVKQLQVLTTTQFKKDMTRDANEMRDLMKKALDANNDVAIFKILQIGTDEMLEAIKTLTQELEKIESPDEPVGRRSVAALANGRWQPETATPRHADHVSGTTTVVQDKLDQDFIESGINALQRLSIGNPLAGKLPSWTIPIYEVEKDEIIGMGTFSHVYRGRWKNQVVAIKVLNPATPRSMFTNEAKIWSELPKHPNVLELLGAASTSSHPPWFFVSPYYKNGSLVTYLQGLPSLDSVPVLKMIHEVAMGMEFLHSREILHGDLKASNVLVDDEHRCIISDFGQSRMKSEVYRRTHTQASAVSPPGTFRWQAPELMSGKSRLTREIDVYAFAITCIEILTKGALPWPPEVDDAKVSQFVLGKDQRPVEPQLNQAWSQQMLSIVHECWDVNPRSRPTFKKVVTRVQDLRRQHEATNHMTSSAPDHKEDQATRVSSPQSEEDPQQMRDEQRYRILLRHQFDPSLTLPLWTPGHVPLGAVGYHSKERGGVFVTLFNSFDPMETSNGLAKDIPSLYGYGKVNVVNVPQPYGRGLVQRGMDYLQSWWKLHLRQYSWPLHPDQMAAYLFTESTEYQHIEDLTAPTRWVMANADRILALYGNHQISKKRLCLVTGTLQAEKYALFVSHSHPDVHVNFNVFSTPRVGQKWGEFTFTFQDRTSAFNRGPNYDDGPVRSPQFATKISEYGREGPWESVLLERLRFNLSDDLEPTSR